MSSEGWYPDPGGQEGLYRYWNGTDWAEAVTTKPHQTPAPPGSGYRDSSGKKGGVGWWIGAVAAVAVIGGLIWAVVTGSPGGSLPGLPPAPLPTSNSCPTAPANHLPTPAIASPGRVSAGKLSFPSLGAPWGEPHVGNRLPFGNMSMSQEALDQNVGRGSNWVSEVVVSDITAGDGIASPQDGAEMVLRCSLGELYTDTEVKAQTISAGEHAVSGHPGWLIEAQLSFDVEGLKAKGERVLVLVVQVEPDLYGAFFASVPDTRPERLVDARRVLAELRVDE